MNNREIENRLKRAVNSAPIDLLSTLKSTDVEKLLSHDEYTRQSKSYRGIFAIAAVLFITIFSLNYYQRMLVDVYSMDINPSVSLGVRRNGKVKYFRANDDGYLLIRDLDLVGMEYENAILKIVSKVEEAGYFIEENNYILIENLDKDNLDRISKIITNSSKENILVLKRHTDNLESSGGLNNLKEEILEKYPNLDRSLIFNMSIRELINYLHENSIEVSEFVEVEGNYIPPKVEPVEEVIEEIIEEKSPEVVPPVVTPPVKVTPPAPTPPKVVPPVIRDDDDDNDDDYYEDDYNDNNYDNNDYDYYEYDDDNNDNNDDNNFEENNN